MGLRCRCGRGCRRARPNCRASRAKWDPLCHCDGYHYPHRSGSKLCVNARGSVDQRNLLLYGPPP